MLRDPLLAAARTLITLSLWLALVGAVLIALAIPVILSHPGQIAQAMVSKGMAINHAPSGPLAIMLAVTLAIIALWCALLVPLRKLIDSVAEGTPFQAHNADRLTRMGWVMLALQLVALPALAASKWLLFYGHGVLTEYHLNGSGLLTVLTLFVLARVFRLGAAMQGELEGTV